MKRIKILTVVYYKENANMEVKSNAHIINRSRRIHRTPS